MRAIEEAALKQRLAAERVPLTVCPLPNVKHCVYQHISQHQLPALLASGLACTLNSDDPAYFGGTMNANWLATFEALPQLGLAEARKLALNSFEASLVDEATKAGWRRKLEEVLAATR